MNVGHAYRRQQARAHGKMPPADICLMIVDGRILALPQDLPETVRE